MVYCHECNVKYDARVHRQFCPGCNIQALHYKPGKSELTGESLEDSVEDSDFDISAGLLYMTISGPTAVDIVCAFSAIYSS